MHQLFYASSEINRQGNYRNNNKLIEKIIIRYEFDDKCQK